MGNGTPETVKVGVPEKPIGVGPLNANRLPTIPVPVVVEGVTVTPLVQPPPPLTGLPPVPPPEMLKFTVTEADWLPLETSNNALVTEEEVGVPEITPV